RRVIMLVERRRPLAPRSSRGWTIFAVLFAMALAVAAGTYRGGAAETESHEAATKRAIKESNELAGAQRPDARETKRGANEAPQRKRQLRYAGRDFDDWRNQLLNDLEPKTRTKAIQALQSFGKNGYGEEAAEAIGQALPSDVDSVSISAANALAAIGAPALPVLIESLKSDRASCRHHAAIAIGHIGPAAVSSADALAKLCEDDDQQVRRVAAVSLARIAYQSDALKPLLDRLIVADDLSTRSGVVQGLAGVLSSSARPLPLLLVAARDPDSNIRSTAAGALAQHGPPTEEVIEALKRLVHDPKEHVSANTVSMLFQSSDNAATAVPVLSEVLLSPELMQQFAKSNAANGIINKLGDPGDAVAIAVPALAKYATPGFEPTIGRVVKAIDALGELGPAAKDAIPALEAWTDGRQHVNFDNGDSIEKHARRALEKIKGDTPRASDVDADGARL
ncbi:MAG TPA: HEAT repeat domain-containing protein, partial [Pirellulales bacterium]|nr:HEAT repeat domain-containing protein [Pirellulales bacterium]